MIRVMIVEDEPPNMRTIIKFVESFNENIKVVATAINGQKALEVLEEEDIDVIFSDVRMPVMDGLQLAEKLNQERPEIITVIISGFQDFEYARQALRFQVYDYLLKPIEEKTIHTVLDTISQELSYRDKNKKKNQIMEMIDETRLEHKVQGMKPEYGVFLICAGAFPMIPNDEMVPAEKFWYHIELEKIVSQVMLEEENSICFKGKSAAERIVVVEIGAEERIATIVKGLMEALEEKSNIAITLAASHKMISLNDIGVVLKALRTKLYRNIRLFQSQIFWLEENQEKNRLPIDTASMIQTIHSALPKGKEQLINSILTVINQLTSAQFTQLQIGDFFKNVIGRKYDQVYNLDLEVAISNAVDEKALSQELAFVILNINHQEAEEHEKNSNPHIVNEIEDYLNNHYQESITTNMLSKRFGFVPSYISKLFRNYKGMSPSEYLMNYRIEKSKQMMLEEPELLCKEVALKVGFSDQHHFSKTFKKQTGMWPTEYTLKK